MVTYLVECYHAALLAIIQSPGLDIGQKGNEIWCKQSTFSLYTNRLVASLISHRLDKG